MKTDPRPNALILAAILASAAILTLPAAQAQDDAPVAPGQLIIAGEEPRADVAPACPLEHTDVVADIVGFISRTTVRQIFTNPLDRKIEAVYVFPLPQDAAVDDMTMLVGDRRVVGLIKERSEAREIYEQARAAGHVAGLLDQERPNIFTQSVANIEPGARVEIEISFVETLKYEDSVFQWVFPMVVGPRYIPGGGSAPAAMTTGQPTPEVPDAHKITPPVIPEGMRAGHDISIAVSIDAGLPIQNLESVLHEINAVAQGDTRVEVTLVDQAAIPNKDFILRYALASDEIGDAFLAHHDQRGDFFTLILQPPRRVVPDQLVNRELIFVLDTSGSMNGFPIAKAKELMSSLIDTMRPGDTFNLITFAGRTNILWDKPRPNTAQNRREAQELIMQQRGGGGTEMMKAIDAALGGGCYTVNQIIDMADVRIVEPEKPGEDGWPPAPPEGYNANFIIPNKPWNEQVTYTVEGLWIYGELVKKIEAMTGASWPMLASEDYNCLAINPLNLSTAEVKKIADGSRVRVTGKIVLTKFGYVLQMESVEPAPLRVVCFLTDGYVGNDMAIIDAVRKNADATRVFSFGIGNSVNRYLMDGLAHAGRGEAEYVTLESQGDAAVQRFHERILAPVLTNIRIDWGTLPVTDVYPKLIPDLFSAKPIMVHGRLAGPAAGTITLHGQTGAGAYEESIEVSLPGAPPDHDALASLWARAKVDDLMNRDLNAVQQGNFPDDLKQQIIDTGVEYRLLTQFTSFVAVEEMTVTVGGEPAKINVPVEMPDGVSYEGVFGAEQSNWALRGPANMKGGGRGRGVMRELSVSARRGGRATVGRTAPPSPPPATSASQLKALGYVDPEDESVESRDAEAIALDPQNIHLQKLAAPLRTLADQVEQNGDAGNLTLGDIKVVDYRVDVMLYLRDLSEETLAVLTELGFVKSAESSTIMLLIGAVDVRKLEDLSKLDAVISVKPLTAP